MKASWKLKLYKFLKIPYCNRCLCTKLNKNCWSRGWDKIYGGTLGSYGIRCFDCGYIEWDVPYQKFEASHNPDQWIIYQDTPRYKDGQPL